MWGALTCLKGPHALRDHTAPQLLGAEAHFSTCVSPGLPVRSEDWTEMCVRDTQPYAPHTQGSRTESPGEKESPGGCPRPCLWVGQGHRTAWAAAVEGGTQATPKPPYTSLVMWPSLLMS